MDYQIFRCHDVAKRQLHYIRLRPKNQGINIARLKISEGHPFLIIVIRLNDLGLFEFHTHRIANQSRFHQSLRLHRYHLY